MTEEKPIAWKLDPPHVSIWGNVLDDKIKGHLKLRSHLEELHDREECKKKMHEKRCQVLESQLDSVNAEWNSLRDRYNKTEENLRGFHGDLLYDRTSDQDSIKLEDEINSMYKLMVEHGFKLNKETQTWSKKDES